MFSLKTITIIISTIILICVTILYLNFSLKTNGKKSKILKQDFYGTQTTNSSMPEIIIHKFAIQELLKNKADVLFLKAEESKIFKSKNQIECITAFCEFKRNNKQILFIQSQKALFDKNKKMIFLFGPTNGQFDKLKIIGKDILYNYSNKTIKTEQKLTYYYPNFSLSTNCSFIDLEKELIDMKNGVKTEITF